MERCPDCGDEAEEDVYSPDIIYDGQGFENVEIHTYTCPKCGCEFTWTVTITRELTVDKHGKCLKCGQELGE